MKPGMRDQIARKRTSGGEGTEVQILSSAPAFAGLFIALMAFIMPMSRRVDARAAVTSVVELTTSVIP